MNQQLNEDEIEKVLEQLSYSNQSDVMAQQLFFAQTEYIRQQGINNARVVESLKNITANNASHSAREEAYKTLKYLGIAPPPLAPIQPSWNIALAGGISALAIFSVPLGPVLRWEGFQAAWICLLPLGLGAVGGYLGQVILLAILHQHADKGLVFISALAGGILMGMIPMLIWF